jgi:hypothetical protein
MAWISVRMKEKTGSGSARKVFMFAGRLQKERLSSLLAAEVALENLIHINNNFSSEVFKRLSTHLHNLPNALLKLLPSVMFYPFCHRNYS